MQNAKFRDYLNKNQFTWLITGVAGFIGSNLLEELLKLNQKVIGLDNFATGYQRNLDEVLQKLPADRINNFSFYFGDICSRQNCEAVMSNVDYVLHQAAFVSVPGSIKDPILTYDVNVTGFLNILNVAKKHKVKRFVYATSSAVYGDSPILPKVETHVGNLLSPYAASKFVDEVYAKTFATCYGIETIGLRYFNVFGQRQDPEGPYAAVIPLWVKAILHDEPVYINGDGETTRDFCHVANVVQANILAALSTNPEAINTVYNVAVGEQSSLNELYQAICSNLHKNSKPKYRAFREGDIRCSLADISKAKELLGYLPTYSVSDGLRIAMEWYKNSLK